MISQIDEDVALVLSN